MTLRHMKIFVAVFRHSNITKAAQELHLALPSVSLAIKELENYYGIRLFERIGKRISPTEGGKEFIWLLPPPIVSLFEEMEKRMKTGMCQDHSDRKQHYDRHAQSSGLIRNYQAEFPDLKINAIISNSSTIENHILDNTIDLGLIETQPEHEDIQAIPFMRIVCAPL